MPSVEQQTFFTPHYTMPFCKGCGHSHILRKLNDALVTLKLKPSDVALVTDIGCIGLADALFENIHTVHTTHGRSTAFATGIQLADAVLANSQPKTDPAMRREKLKTIVLIGDGGAMIGLQHLVNAALLNVDVTVILANNFLFGMTGGQNSAFSPFDFITPTTPKGNIIPPIDMCRVMIDARAEFVARKTATDKDLSSIVARAIEHPGFSLVEIVELCTEHASTRNEIAGNALAQIVEAHGEQLGVLIDASTRKPFGSVYAEKYPQKELAAADSFLEPKFSSTLDHSVGIVIAGSAGERVQSSAKKFCDAAVLSGLHCTQKNENPVTQGSGFSLSEAIISPEEIHFTGIEIPSVVIVVSQDGLRELKDQHMFDRMPEQSALILDSSLEAPTTKAEIYRYPFRKEFTPAKAALKALEFYLSLSKIFPQEAFQQFLAAK
jgi:2-oxoglutarate ferredoxin oxidoreductase subunit beta